MKKTKGILHLVAIFASALASAIGAALGYVDPGAAPLIGAAANTAVAALS